MMSKKQNKTLIYAERLKRIGVHVQLHSCLHYWCCATSARAFVDQQQSQVRMDAFGGGALNRFGLFIVYIKGTFSFS